MRDTQSGFSVGLLALAGFGVLLHGVSILFNRDRELAFVEVYEDSIKYRNPGFGVSGFKTSDIEFAIIGGASVEFALKDTNSLIVVEYRGITPRDLEEILIRVAPNAGVKIRED